MKIEIVASFHAGEAVPEWLLCRTPERDDADPGEFTFAVDCHIVQTSDGYVVVIDRIDDGFEPFKIDGAHGIEFSAPSLPVRHHAGTFFPKNDARRPSTPTYFSDGKQLGTDQ
jgi:hypothetical protein